MPSQTVQLLPEKEIDDDEWSASYSEPEDDTPWQKKRRSRASIAYQAILHVLLFFTIAYITTNHFWPGMSVKLEPKSPSFTENLRELYAADVASESHEHHSIYSGDPTPENIRAWDDLVDPSFIAITEEELIELGGSPDKAVRLEEPAGHFVAGLAAHHYLHCVRQLRWWVFKETYYRDMTEDQIKIAKYHLAHCIESLRVATMCSADLTVYTFVWDDPNAIRPNPQLYKPRMCTKWDPIDQWARERSVGYYPTLYRPNETDGEVHMR